MHQRTGEVEQPALTDFSTAPVQQTSPSSQPVLPPLARVAVYLTACMVAGGVGAVPGAVVAFTWLFAQHGELSEKVIERGMGVIVLSVLFGIYPFIILTTWLFVRYIDRRPLNSIGLTTQRWGKEMGGGAALGIVFMSVTMGVYLALDWIRLTPTSTSWGGWLILTLGCLLVGFTEEMMFRGYLLTHLEEWRSRRVAIAVTTVLFWMAHLGMGNVHHPLGAADMLAIGLTFALCRVATRSLWLPIGLHAGYNWIALSIGGDELGFPALYHMEVRAPHWLVGPPGYVGVADLVFGLLLLGFVYGVLYRPSQRQWDAVP
ncbi:MAG: CPBP family intramembrane metalloprotease [Abditibacteriales bacterium]|nr:CPBP family intramembrane metalloprotease [Abditibacteriales bacterium]MDW8366340.1 type II CAAX endopeptidase family protein [Abditibacteriales bacterium]